MRRKSEKNKQVIYCPARSRTKTKGTTTLGGSPELPGDSGLRQSAKRRMRGTKYKAKVRKKLPSHRRRLRAKKWQAKREGSSTAAPKGQTDSRPAGQRSDEASSPLLITRRSRNGTNASMPTARQVVFHRKMKVAIRIEEGTQQSTANIIPFATSSRPRTESSRASAWCKTFIGLNVSSKLWQRSCGGRTLSSRLRERLCYQPFRLIGKK